jgi:hypothetical protein
MKTIQWLVVSAALAIGMATPALAATSDPEVIIYRFPGVRDDVSGSDLGVATVFHCTSFSGETETIRFVVRQFQTSLVSNTALPINHLATLTVSTHLTAAYNPETSLAPFAAPVQGSAAIAATSTSIICTAMTIDAANPKPTGVALRGIRFSPVPGSQE